MKVKPFGMLDIESLEPRIVVLLISQCLLRFVAMHGIDKDHLVFATLDAGSA